MANYRKYLTHLVDNQKTAKDLGLVIDPYELAELGLGNKSLIGSIVTGTYVYVLERTPPEENEAK